MTFPIVTNICFVLAMISVCSAAQAQSQQAMLGLAQLMQQAGDEAAAKDYGAAEATSKKAVEFAERNFAADAPALIATARNRLSQVYYFQNRFVEAEAESRAALALRLKQRGVPAWTTGIYRVPLAQALAKLGKQAEAEREIEQALADYRAGGVAEVPLQTQAWNALGRSYYELGRWDDAIVQARRCLAAYAKALGEDHVRTLTERVNLGRTMSDAGRDAEAETTLRDLLAVHRRSPRRDPALYATHLNEVAGFYLNRNRLDDALPLIEETLAVREKQLGAKDPATLETVGLLAEVRRVRGDDEISRQLRQRLRDALGDGVVSSARPEFAMLEMERMLFDFIDLDVKSAVARLETSLAAEERRVGSDSPDLMRTLILAATMHFNFGSPDKTTALLERAEKIAAAHPERTASQRLQVDELRARILQSGGLKRKAADLLEKSLERSLAAVLNGGAGTPFDRALALGSVAEICARLAAWRYEERDVPGLFRAAELVRSRVMLEQINARNVDEYAGLPADQAAEFRSQLGEAYRRLTLAQAAALTDKRAAARSAVDEARDRYVATYRALLNAGRAMKLSPVGSTPVDLAQLQGWCERRKSLMLYYAAFPETTYLIFVQPGAEAQAFELSVSAESGGKLEIPSGLIRDGEPGNVLSSLGQRRLEELSKQVGKAPAANINLSPLTAGRLRMALENRTESGVLQLLSQPKESERLVPKLLALGELLLPAEVRGEIVGSKQELLTIVSDGALDLLPFDALMTDSNKKPTYLLEIAPPLTTVSSAALLLRLDERRETPTGTARSPILTLADPQYEAATAANSEAVATSRLLFPGSKPTAIPNSGVESQWIADVFQDAGRKVGYLRGDDATEKRLRAMCDNRLILHLACHGYVDRAHGNLFGALALTPGTDAALNPDDDGLLTIAEVSRLDLRGTELAILSACETNIGPQQFGEGTSGLSRAFLIAGVKRVVAGNWLVDDQAAASQVSYFCSIVARAMRRNEPVDYAAALHKAKLWTKEQVKWKHPYYWAVFTHVGPR